MSGEDDVEHEASAGGTGGTRVLPFVAVAVVALAAGYGIGFARGSADLDGGSGPTTSVVAPLPGGGDVTLPATPTTEAQPPPMPATTVSLAEATTPTVDGATLTADGAWEVADGAATTDGDWPDDAEAPPPPSDAPHLLIEAETPVTVVTARLATATAWSGVALAVDGDDAWQLAIAPGLGELRVYRVVDGTAEQRGTLPVAVGDGTALGLFWRDGRVGVLVDGEQRAVEGFFGVELDLDADGAEPAAAAVVAGSGRTAVAELAFG